MHDKLSPKIKVITPGSNSLRDYMLETWQYKHLIYVFAKQEFKTQYVQTRFNIFWVMLRPLMVLALFTFIFDRLIHIPGLAYPYPLFAISGLIIWNNFSFMINNGGNVIISNQNVIKKIYFPKIILLLSKVLVSLIELSATVVLLLILIIIYHHPLDWKIVFFPVFISLGLLVSMSIAIWLNAMTVAYRDLHQFVPTMLGFVIWLTPVFYPVSLIPKHYAFIIYLNPIAGVIQGFRWSVLGDKMPSVWFVPMFMCLFLTLLTGLWVFIRSEANFADLV